MILETTDHPHLRQSTKLFDFAYSSYNATFVSFLMSLHSLSESVSNKEAVVDPFWQTAMADELTALHQTHTLDMVPLPSKKMLLVLVGSIRLKLNMMDPWNNTRLALLQKASHMSMT